MPSRVEKLAQLIRSLEASDPAGDRFKFLPPLNTQETRRLESRLGVQLPPEYRRFLQVISRGGAPTRLGPPHLMPPDEALRDLRQEGGHPAARFPLGNRVARRLIEAKLKQSKTATSPAEPRDISDGVLPLMNHGDGMLDLLVLTGPQRGKVWQAWEAGWTPLYREEGGRARQLGFLSWLRWMLEGD